MASKALLVVSFGTSVEQTRIKTIDAIEEDLAAAFPDRVFFSAWTSRIIVAKIERETGLRRMNALEALDAIEAAGFDDVLVQPTHMMDAKEMVKVTDAIAVKKEQGCFDSIRLGAPLLVAQSDRARIAQALAEEFPAREGRSVVVMGHGTPGGSNEVYYQMQEELDALGRSDFIIATVEGKPCFADVLSTLERKKPASVMLAPFMIVAGDHALNDLAGEDEDSWKSQLAAQGYKVDVTLKGLGEYPAIRNLFVSHAQKAQNA